MYVYCVYCVSVCVYLCVCICACVFVCAHINTSAGDAACVRRPLSDLTPTFEAFLFYSNLFHVVCSSTHVAFLLTRAVFTIPACDVIRSFEPVNQERPDRSGGTKTDRKRAWWARCWPPPREVVCSNPGFLTRSPSARLPPPPYLLSNVMGLNSQGGSLDK